ncbi:MAG: glutathione S-transferase family protein [Shewanella psychromarinicola]|uniref:glutathione S-transferase family protein n=1 Tax=Shewanella TaxID=22 RepID=UPI000C33CAE5|nr:glutathione S-transferase family protein [Shewanella sp. Actino-trap-3]PKG78554.1 glutathione S-transferase [Shewanella sp. Actino-trap-3]|tara:strand:- start:24165 stop:24785 length:621 start_codon:yes stop_codon:yes gene_type:complete
MITLHHLNKSRSKRIIWLLEELGVDYNLVAYQRDTSTFLGPESLKKVHPLGKSPVLEASGYTIAESGAITDYLIQTYAADRLMPAPGTADYIDYQQWMHFAESSAALPLLLKMFVKMEGAETQFIGGYADAETAKVIGYVNDRLDGKSYLVGNSLSGADIMMSFIAEIVGQNGEFEKYPNIANYYQQLMSHTSFKKALQIEAEHDR